ncbi:F-box domain-containing protein [Mycena sanguinolenta]|uniref:F-box domain-containing protein n=1 Tax=Mycena sanguinolenta TaxID=230812 RepID=A0A8H6X8F3_9AGAR|nr:F-box domain-containing protein [Mycena sanguinolenta]
MPSPCSQCGAFVLPADDVLLDRTPHTLARLAQLSASDEPPGTLSCPSCDPSSKKTSKRLTLLDEEIPRLKDRLQELETERTALSESHAQNIRILSPLRRIPAEILGEIFSWSLPSHWDVLDVRNCPWVLTHVCRRWRAVALSMTSLWSLISVDFETKPQYPRAMISTQIERARSLKIHFFGYEDCDASSQIALFELLAIHSHRWEELSIQLTSHLGPCVMKDRDLTALRRTWVQWHNAESQTPEFNSVDFLRTATSLVEIGVCCDFRFLPTRLPTHHQLTRYDFDAPWRTHVELLKSLPNIQAARISRHFDNFNDWPEPGDPIDLPHLRRLYVTDHPCLDYLRTPRLEELAIALNATDNKGHLDAQSTAAILQKNPSFTEFGVTDEDENEDAQRRILSTFLTLFTISNSTPSAMLPHIMKISFASESGDSTLYPLFLDMLESRWKPEESVLKIRNP